MTQEEQYRTRRIDKAIKENFFRTVKELLPKDIKTILINGNHTKYNVLQRACFYGSPSLEMIKYLLDNGMDVNNLPQANSGSPLALLCQSGTANLERIKFLVENGANLGEDTY
ncbi:ankyrin repeat [Anaeramoeba flamelloides]|uniref:Ankyrin repeat n=1 Tax=Anaeramoeba flamelloides TaxID=1746091 RepID=A0ABQ8XMG4_9EUKA|nr:ankyrin repeat [Anaeramoeba flamelloides]